MLTRSYVVRELTINGLHVRPMAFNWDEGYPGTYLFGDEYSDKLFKSRGDAEKAIYDFFFRMWKKEGGPMHVVPRFTVIELFGFEGE
jgi:hypothetical protein